MTLLFDLVHIGQNIYDSNSSSWNPTIVGVIIGGVLGFVGSLVIFLIQDWRKKNKEKKRILDLRMALYAFLDRWQQGIKDQVVEIDKTIAEYTPKRGGFGEEIKNENIRRIHTSIAGIDADILPTQISKINIDDIFKILVGKKSSTNERLKILAEIYGFVNLTTLLFDRIFKDSEDHKLLIINLSQELNNQFTNIFYTIDRLHVESDRSLIGPSFTLAEMVKFNNDYENNKVDTSINNKFARLINPILELSKIREHKKSIEGDLIFPMMNEYARQYVRILDYIDDYYQKLVFWKERFTEAIAAIERLFDMEFNDLKHNKI